MFNMTSGLVRFVHRICLCAAVAACLSTQIAKADIAAYNEAVLAKDFPSAVTAAESIWATWERSDPQTLAIIEEFTFSAARANDLDAIDKFAADWISVADAVQSDAVTKSIANLARNYVYFARTPRRETAEVFANALEARIALGGTDLQSILYASHGYNVSLAQKPNKQYIRIAEALAALWGAAGPTYLPQQWHAQMEALGLEFVLYHKRDTYQRMGQLLKTNVALWEQNREAVPFTETRKEYYDALAWGYAIQAYMESDGKRVNDWEDLSIPTEETGNEKPESELPFCKNGKFTNQKLPEYPRQSAFRLPVGAVVLLMKLNEDGQVSAAEVLGSMPTNAGFEKATTDAVLKWRWKVDKKTEPGSCTLKHDNMIQPFMFVVR